MKLNSFAKWTIFALVLTVAVAGCRKRPSGVKDIYGSRAGNPDDLASANAIPPINTSPGDNLTNLTGTPLPGPDIRKDWPRDSEIFKQYTVHFDFDSSNVKAGERSKVSAVADYLKGNPNTALEVDGHCDERGTEEYNRSLGERRALALRDNLVQLGIDPMRIDTVSYGKDKPAVPGHNEAAWRQNRRGEFLLETPPAAK